MNISITTSQMSVIGLRERYSVVAALALVKKKRLEHKQGEKLQCVHPAHTVNYLIKSGLIILVMIIILKLYLSPSCCLCGNHSSNCNVYVLYVI